MTKTVTIRQRRNEDLPSLAAVLVRVHAVDGYPVEGVADLDALLNPRGEIASWVAEASGAPIGHASLTRPPADEARLWLRETGLRETAGDAARVALLERLFVDPGHRSYGAGRLLVQAAIDHARVSGLAVALVVMTKDRSAIRLYERMGARLLGSITHHHSGGLSEPAAVYAFEGT